MRRLEEIESELEALGATGGLTSALPVRSAGDRVGEIVDVSGDPELDAWSRTVVTAVMKVMWAGQPPTEVEAQYRRSNRARELAALATPIEFDAPAPAPPRRPEPEAPKPPSWAWAAGRRVS